jgi:ketosteroid isomerase-like protein
VSEETRQLVERVLVAFCGDDGPDLEGIAHLFSDDHVFVPAGEAGEVGGQGGYVRWSRDISEVMPMRYDGASAIDCGPGKAIGVINNHYQSASGGVGSVQRMWIVFNVRDGKVVRSEAFTDPDLALEAARG